MVNQIIKRALKDLSAANIERGKPHLPVISLCGQRICAETQRAGEYMTAVIIRVLPDHIDSARCEKCPV